MTCPNQSLVKMDPKEVVRIAEEYLAWAKEEKAVAYEYHMNASRAELTQKLNAWYRFFWKRNPTEEEVWNDFVAGDIREMFPMKYRVDIGYGIGEDVAENLIKACKFAKDEMYVSVDDLARIT